MTGKLTKAELSRQIAQNCESSLKEGKEILELILSAMAHAISKGDRVEIRGFGSFATRVRRARIGRNPKTGVLVSVPAKRVPYFRPSKDLRASL
jgi:integration host factor subunit beta